MEEGAKEALNPAEMLVLKREPSTGQGEMKEKPPMGRNGNTVAVEMQVAIQTYLTTGSNTKTSLVVTGATERLGDGKRESSKMGDRYVFVQLQRRPQTLGETACLPLEEIKGEMGAALSTPRAMFIRST